MKIEKFAGEYAFLSNFFPCDIEIEGINYPTLEHAFQAAKTHDHATRQTIAAKPTPGGAKRAGGKRGIIKGNLFRQDWEQIKVQVMKDLLQIKFGQEPFRSMLLATGDAELIEGNIWNDTFWGVCRGKGRNTLGLLLQEIRAEIQAEIFLIRYDSPDQIFND